MELEEGVAWPDTGTVQVDQELPFRVTISNAGGNASNVQIIIPLPLNCEFVSSWITLPAAAIPDEVSLEDNSINMHWPILPAGARVELWLVIKALESGNLSLAPQVWSAELPNWTSAAPPTEVIAGKDSYTVISVLRPYNICGQTGLVPLLSMLPALSLTRRTRRRR
jgi:uncharacterized repeat protein (TIGR01451 family)